MNQAKFKVRAVGKARIDVVSAPQMLKLDNPNLTPGDIIDNRILIDSEPMPEGTHYVYRVRNSSGQIIQIESGVELYVNREEKQDLDISIPDILKELLFLDKETLVTVAYRMGLKNGVEYAKK